MPPADQDRPFSTGTFNGEEFRVLPDQSAFNSLVAGQIDADGQLFTNPSLKQSNSGQARIQWRVLHTV